ncbi:MAG: NUDIX domain-containing protein [Phycicoccus sp.]|nr:NUDIX domain-containing protein [Phycicoccus sp.]
MHRIVIGALVRDRQVLLALRSPSKHANPGVWDLPGGHVEADESELAALARELHEELGVQIAPSSALPLARVDTGPADDKASISAWLVRDWLGMPANLASDEHDEIAWFDLDDLPPLAHPPVHAALIAAGAPPRP